jgi:hypothetical protein
MEVNDFGLFEFATGNGNKKHNEWSSHYIKGYYQVVKIEDEKIYLKEENIIFPVLKSRITKFEKIESC